MMEIKKEYGAIGIIIQAREKFKYGYKYKKNCPPEAVEWILSQIDVEKGFVPNPIMEIKWKIEKEKLKR